MQVSRLENEMACAIFELDWFTYVIDAGNNDHRELGEHYDSIVSTNQLSYAFWITDTDLFLFLPEEGIKQLLKKSKGRSGTCGFDSFEICEGNSGEFNALFKEKEGCDRCDVVEREIWC